MNESNAYQDDGDRYVIIEIPPEATAVEFEQVASGAFSFAAKFNRTAVRGDWDLFAFVPHAYQEQVLRELFGEEPAPDATEAEVAEYHNRTHDLSESEDEST